MYLPFHTVANGSQTSKPMLESLLGVAMPETRQKAGMPVKVADGAIGPVAGAVKLPAGTDWAVVMVAPCRNRPFRSSHARGAADEPPQPYSTAPARAAAASTYRIMEVSCLRS